jgi:hypothetical protein
MLDLFGCNSIESLLTTIGQLQHLTNLLLKWFSNFLKALQASFH